MQLAPLVRERHGGKPHRLTRQSIPAYTRYMKNLRAAQMAMIAVIVVLLAACTITVAPTETPMAQGGTITGTLGYPSDQIPPLRVYAVEVESGEFHTIDTDLNQMAYSLSVPVGTYHVFAYLLEDDPDFAGGYTEFVLCGLRADCPSHALIAVLVGPGEHLDSIDLTDWYAPPGSLPSRPDAGDEGD